MKKPLVSVIVPTYNISNLTKNCVKSILNQTFEDFELFVIDDCSSDNTLKSLNKFNDKRLKIFKTKKNSGPSAARNIGIKNSRGKYIFFIDGDCTANRNWIKEGLGVFQKQNCIGVEGKIYYVSKSYVPRAIDRVTENLNGGSYMTASMAYKREIVMKVGNLKENLMRMHDRYFAFIAMKYGKIIFSEKMYVKHQKFLWTFKKIKDNFWDDAHDRVVLFKEFGDRGQIHFRIYRPLNLLGVFFPPAILGLLLIKKFRKLEDFKIILWAYPAFVLERISLWKNAIKNKVFLI